MDRALVFIDGSNFYFRLKDLTARLGGRFSLLQFDFRKFSEWVARPYTLVEVRYYVGADKGLSFGLTKASDELIVLKPQDIVPFLGQRLL